MRKVMLAGVVALLGVAAIGAIVALRREETPGRTPSTSRAPAPVTGRAQEPVAAVVMPAAVERVPELARRIRTEKDAVRRCRLLEEIAKPGSPESVDALIALMEEGLEIPHAAELFASALMDVDDPRIGPAARRAIDRGEARGQDSWYETHGYLKLIAAKGGSEGSRFVVDVIRDGRYQSAGIARDLVATLGDRSPAPRLLELAGKQPAGEAIAEGLAAWHDPAVNLRLEEMAADTGIARALGRHVDPADIARFIRASGPGADERLARLQGVLSNPGLDAATLEGTALPALVTMLHDPRQAIAAADLAASSERLHRSDLAVEIEGLLAATWPVDDRKSLLRSLSRVRGN